MTYSETSFEANRRNAAKSTGPKTPEGKAASSRNALKHGLTATEFLLPNEDRDAYDARLQTWIDHDRPTDPGHVAAIERFVYTQMRLDRCTLHETETTKQRLLHAIDCFEADALATTYAVGRRLIDDPYNRALDSSTVPFTVDVARQERWIVDEPAVLLLQLQSSAQGIDWLLARWRELLHMLDSELSWNFYYQNRAIRLLGKRIEDMYDDQASRQVFAASFAAGKDVQSWGIRDMGMQTLIGAAGRITDAFRHAHVATLAPATREQGREVLRGIMNEEIDRLMRLRREQRLEDVEQMDRDGAEARALIDVSHAGVLLRRYETATEREFHKTLAEIQAFRKASAAPIRNEPVSQPARNPQVASTPPPPPPSHPATTDQGSPISASALVRVPALPIPRRKWD
jgi:hypothetical protein